MAPASRLPCRSMDRLAPGRCGQASRPGRASRDPSAALTLRASCATPRWRRPGASARAPRRVAIALPPGEDSSVALHACLLAGAAAVPIDLRLSAAEQEQRRAGRETRVGGTASRPRPSVTDASRGHAHLGHHLRAQAGGADSATAWPARSARRWRSGSTRHERWLCPMPLTHVGGLSIPIRSAIYATTAVLHGRFDDRGGAERADGPGGGGSRSSRWCRRCSRGCSTPVSSARRRCAGRCSAAARSRRRCSSGRQRPGCPVAPTYGMTEACSQIATFGWPLPGVELRIAGDGEMLVRGPIVSRRARWPRTAGCTRAISAELRRARAAEIVGRKADTIVSGGENVAPAEVEAVAARASGGGRRGVFSRARIRSGGRRWSRRVVLRDGAERRRRGAARALRGAARRRSRCPRRSSSPTGCRGRPSGKLLAPPADVNRGGDVLPPPVRVAPSRPTS